MLWQLLRDIGLILFLAGGLILFELRWIYPKNSHVPHALWMRKIADAAMLGGACIAVIAMLMGYFLSVENP
jgi:hypothetical protein